MKKQTIGKGLRILAVIVALGFVGTWLSLGANTGWTKTSVPVTMIDEITDIESQTWEDKFVPGLEFLGAGLFVAIVVGGASFFFRKS
jgi:hypothetical protein